MCESLRGEWALGLMESALTSAAISEDREGNLLDWIFWGQYTYLGMQCHVRPAETGIRHLFNFTALMGQDGFTGIIPVTLCFSFLAACQRKCASMTVTKIDTVAFIILKES